MRVTRHDHIEDAIRKLDQRALESANCGTHVRDLSLCIEAQIERDLVVATACRVKLRACRTDPLRQCGFDVHVHVYELRIPLKCTARNLFFYRSQAADDARDFPFVDDSGVT